MLNKMAIQMMQVSPSHLDGKLIKKHKTVMKALFWIIEVGRLT